MISLVAICATLFFVSCGGDSKTPTKVEGDTDTTDTGNEGDKTDSDSGNNGEGDTTPSGDTDADTATDTDNPDTATDTDNPDTATDTDADTATDTDDPDTATDTDTDTTPENCELSDLEQEFVGTWAMKIILRSASTTSGIGALAGTVPSVTTRYLVAEIKPNKDCKLDFFKKDNQLCRTDNRTGDSSLTKGRVGFNDFDGSKFNTVFFHWKPYDIPGHENDPYLEIAENGGEKTFKLNKDWELRGAKMTDPSTEKMIDSDNDERIFDHDADTHPAFTILFSSKLASGQMYYVQRLSHIFTSKVVSEGKIKGNVEWTDEQYAHSATENSNLAAKKETETDTSKSVFQLVKVDDSMNCATLLEKADNGEIFNIEDPNTDVPHNEYEN